MGLSKDLLSNGLNFWFASRGIELAQAFVSLVWDRKFVAYFYLGEKIARIIRGNLLPKIISETTKIFYLEFLAKIVLKFSDGLKIISIYNHDINIKHQKDRSMQRVMNKENMITRTKAKAKLSCNSTELSFG